jgi:hypothetical protein
MYPLANDENGHPVEVPVTATGWLVRRHAGGKGRPGGVYDSDGRPLVVDLDVTVAVLRANGCGAGAYRLEAVDASRRALGVVAFTEVPETGDVERAAETGGRDAALEAMARTMEAMQRVQAEDKRQTAEMFNRLIDRIAPPPSPPSPSLRETLGEYAEMNKALRKIATVSEASAPTTHEEQTEGIGERVVVKVVEKVLEQAIPFVQAWVWKAMGLSPEQMRGLAGLPVNSDSPAESPISVAQQQLEAVFDLLSEEERAAVQKIIADMPAAVLADAQKHLGSLPPEQAATWVRGFLPKRGTGGGS